MAATDIDLLIYGGIARDAFEPATAAEVAGRLGAKPLHAMDVTCACAGLIEALHVVAGYFALHDELRTALICAGELTGDRINYDMQSIEDVALGAAGLTLGHAAAAFLVTREPLPQGGARVVGMRHKTLSEHYALCRAPVDGKFMSTVDRAVRALDPRGTRDPPPPHGCRMVAGGRRPLRLPPAERGVVEQVLAELGARPQACVHTHSLFGNTASTSWALALDYRLRHGTVQPGDKIVVASAAAGFTIVCAAAVWEC